MPDFSSPSRSLLWWQIALVLAVSLGQQAVYSVLTLVRRLTIDVPLAQQSAQLNPVRADQAVWDAVYRLLDVGFDLAVVALAVLLLWEPGSSALRRIGLDLTRLRSDLARGAALFVVIGVPGLGLYALARAIGANVAVAASDPAAAWWTVPLLVLSALRAGLVEEVIGVAWLYDRLRRLGWGWWTIILSTAALRGAYHAYQGFGAIVGNVVMGVVFGWCYRRWGRVMPLVLAHTLLDVVAFVGYPLAAGLWPDVFAPSPAPTPSPSPSPGVSPGPAS